MTVGHSIIFLFSFYLFFWPVVSTCVLLLAALHVMFPQFWIKCLEQWSV